MGCWNKTCGLSRLHILAGEPVYVFVLEKQENSGNGCYATALYKPLLLPFESFYDDYGGGTDSFGPGLSYIEKGLQELLLEKEQGTNQYHDIPVSKKDFNINKFFEAVHEGRLEISEGTPIDFVMIRKDIVEHIFQNWQKEYYVGEGKGTGGWNNNYIIYSLADVLADVPAFMDKLEAHLKNNKTRFPSLRPDLDPYTWEERAQNKVSWYLSNENYRYSSIVRPSRIIVDLINENRKEEAQEILIEYLKGQYIDSFYHFTRNIWAPGCHEGSQSQEHSGYRCLVSAITSALDKEQQEIEEDEE